MFGGVYFPQSTSTHLLVVLLIVLDFSVGEFQTYTKVERVV